MTTRKSNKRPAKKKTSAPAPAIERLEYAHVNSVTGEQSPASPVPQEVHPPAPAPVILPSPPSPAVLALQDDIVSLIRSRATIRMKLHEAHARFIAAQTEFQIAQSEMKNLEDEVQYLHSQCAQMDGRNRAEAPQAPQQMIPIERVPYNLEPSQVPQGFGVFPGVSSEVTAAAPPQNTAPYRPPADMVNRGHARELRDVL